MRKISPTLFVVAGLLMIWLTMGMVGEDVPAFDPHAPITQLEVGETITLTIQSAPKWNWTGLRLVAGHTYQMSVDANDTWDDWTVITNADGYDAQNLEPFEPYRRVPDANWFALIGTVGLSLDEAFLIGTGTTYTPTSTGLMFPFANDLPIMYWNNEGDVSLVVTRTE